jgi:hypothetical protein
LIIWAGEETKPPFFPPDPLVREPPLTPLRPPLHPFAICCSFALCKTTLFGGSEVVKRFVRKFGEIFVAFLQFPRFVFGYGEQSALGY